MRPMQNKRGTAPGAHALRILGLGEGTRRLATVAAESPSLEIVRLGPDRDAQPTPGGHVRLLPGRAEIGLTGRGSIVVSEESGRATFHTVAWPPDEEILHPYLSTVAAVRARWSGHDAFHAGAFLVDGAVWGILGRRGSGKSTLLASLAERAVSVVSDDLLVVDAENVAYAGPRFVDLRRNAAEQLGLGEPLGRVGARLRWRLQLPAVESTAPMRGWIVLRWNGPAPELEPVNPATRVELLAQGLAIGAPPADPGSLLRHVSMPMWCLARPRDWRSADDSVTVLLERLRSV
jgi:hypothetical protein